ncbi:MAG: hypothetical protein IJP68_09800, partial [Selenomonadaceae bacterium]|nr:hypothetical protein [Selenomonadaceae bacterium]
ELYTERWNHFQDFYNHYNAGAFYRTQTITILDDVHFYHDPNGLNSDINGDVVVLDYGKTSSVAATSATINTTVDPDTGEKSLAYNPGISAQKTYKKFIKSSNGVETAITESGTVGLPYTWKRVDSLNADFRVEVNLAGWFGEKGYVNWDISLDDFSGVSQSNADWNIAWATKGLSGEEKTNAEKAAKEYIQGLRIHTSINFDGAYPVRDADKDPIDILWMRIESEPMLYNPDVKHNGDAVRISESSLNSVNQIILNVNSPNSADENYRPFIIFYDGPEYYEANKEIRASKPVILNLKKAWRGVLYAANSPVVVIGAARDQFVGFVVAKEYHRLAKDSDFIEGGSRYFNNEYRKTEYFKNDDGSFVDANGKAPTSTLYELPVYYLKTDTEKTTRYYKLTDENGITMFVDDRGDIATFKLNDPEKRYGEFSNFGRTDFTTHGYHIPTASSSNMLLSE